MPGIKVKLVRTRAARTPDQRATLLGLGLYKRGQERILPDTPSTLGMCEKLRHMVEWSRVDQDPVIKPRRRPRAAAGEAPSPTGETP